jgi:hypothetical protein
MVMTDSEGGIIVARIELKGWKAIPIALILLLALTQGPAYFRWRAANTDRDSAAKAVKKHLELLGASEILQDNDSEVQKAARYAGLVNQLGKKVTVLGCRSALVGHQVLKVRIGLEKPPQQTRVAYFRVHYHPMTDYWDVMTIRETTEAAYRWCLWRGMESE